MLIIPFHLPGHTDYPSQLLFVAVRWKHVAESWLKECGYKWHMPLLGLSMKHYIWFPSPCSFVVILEATCFKLGATVGKKPGPLNHHLDESFPGLSVTWKTLNHNLGDRWLLIVLTTEILECIYYSSIANLFLNYMTVIRPIFMENLITILKGWASARIKLCS